MITGQRRHLTVTPFDPRASAQFALRILSRAGVPYALIGRVATWSWLPPQAQGPTKDVDVAVAVEAISKVKEVIEQEGLVPAPLRIGGFSVQAGEVCVDFIDRHVDGFGALFSEAIHATEKAGNVADIGGIELPVVPPEYLMAMKMIPGTDKDEEDVVRLLAAHAELDYAFTRELVRLHLGAATVGRLDELARKAGRPDAPQRYL